MHRWLTKRHASVKRFTALLVFAVFVQTLAAALLHVALVEHVWCESHGEFEHLSAGDAHKDGVESARQLTTQMADDSRGDKGDGDHFPPDPSAPDALCFYLTSLYGPAVPQPPMIAVWTSLPPPGEPQPRTILATSLVPARQIDLLRVSPGLSPPQLLS